MKYKLNTLSFLLVFLVISCKKELAPDEVIKSNQTGDLQYGTARLGQVDNTMVLYWNEKIMSVLPVHTNPGSDGRHFAMIQIAIHDALNSIVPKYACYALKNERYQFADPDAAVASAAYWTIKGLNLQGNLALDTWYQESLGTVADGPAKEQGKILGKKAADAIISNRANDGYNQVAFVSLFPLNGTVPGAYRSTLPASNPALNLPQLRFVSNWGTVIKPFMLQSNSQFRPAGPNPVNSIAYVNDYNEVKAKGALIGSTRTEQETTIKNFWADIRQHLVWNIYVRKILEVKKEDAWKTARLFALIHSGMADGASAMFEAKYHFYYWRPETAIRGDDSNPNTASDPGWLPSGVLRVAPDPLLNAYNPGVPEYPSGSILGSVTGKILQHFFETDQVAVQLNSLVLPGITLNYNRISEVINDNSMCKIFAGWYFRKSVEDGDEMGRQIADYVFNNFFTENE